MNAFKTMCLTGIAALAITVAVPAKAHADMVIGPFPMGTGCPGGRGVFPRYAGNVVYCVFDEQVFSAVYSRAYCPSGVPGAVTVSGRISWCLVYQPGQY